MDTDKDTDMELDIPMLDIHTALCIVLRMLDYIGIDDTSQRKFKCHFKHVPKRCFLIRIMTCRYLKVLTAADSVLQTN